VKYYALKEKHDDLVEKLKFFTGVSSFASTFFPVEELGNKKNCKFPSGA